MQQNTRNLKANLAASYTELVSSFTALSCDTIGNYTLGKAVGKGSFGKAYQASHKFLGSRIVLKSTPKSEAPNLAREIHHHRRLHHPHIVQLYEVIITEEKVWLAMESCPHGELYDHLLNQQQLEESETQRIFSEVCGAVAYIHSKGIVHRDLKLENIFLDRHDCAKLGDFGFTREDSKTLLTTWCGSLAYCAPEIVRGDKYQGQPVDIWSLGIILFTLLSGYLPFDENEEAVTKRMIINDAQTYPPFFSEDVKNLLDLMLHKDPSLRPSALEVLKHPFLSGYAALQIAHLDDPYTPTFDTRLERIVLDRLGAAGIDLEKVMKNVIDYRCDPLCGWWWLSLERERRRERRYQNHLRAKSIDLTADEQVVERTGRLRSRSRSRGAGQLRLAESHRPYQFPAGTVSNNAHISLTKPVRSASEDSHIVNSSLDERRALSNAPLSVLSKSQATFHSQEIKSVQSKTASNSHVPQSNEIPDTPKHRPQEEDKLVSSTERAQELHKRKQGILHTFKHWWAEQTKSKTSSVEPSIAGYATSTTNLSSQKHATQTEATSHIPSIQASPCPDPGMKTGRSRPIYERRQSSQYSLASGRRTSSRPTPARRRSSTGLQVTVPTAAMMQALRSPSPNKQAMSKEKLVRARPNLQRTMSQSSNQSSVNSFRGSGQASHSKASSTSSNSTFKSTRSLRTPRNPLKVMPATPPPFMIAHRGGYREHNVFELSLASNSGSGPPVAFASRNKSKRGVLLKSKKDRRRISLTEEDMIEEEEEDGGESEYIDVEEGEVEERVSNWMQPMSSSRDLLDLEEEQEDEEAYTLDKPIVRERP